MPGRDAQAVHGSQASILLVDDDSDFVEMATTGLSLLGYTIAGFTDATEAEASFADNAQRYDVLVSDVCMANMSGLELVRQVRKASDTIPIILMSGRTETLDRSQTQPLRVTAILSKPVTPRSLADAIESVLKPDTS